MRIAWSLALVLGVVVLTGCPTQHPDTGTMRITYDRNRSAGVLSPSDGEVVQCAAEDGECGFAGLHRTATLSFRNPVPVDYRMYEVSADGTETLLLDTTRLEDRQHILEQNTAASIAKLRVPFIAPDGRFIRNAHLVAAFDSIAEGRFDPYLQRDVSLNGVPLQLAADGTFDIHTQPFDDQNQVSDNVLTFARRADETCTVGADVGMQTITVGENSIELRLRSPLRISDQNYGLRTVREVTISLRCSTSDGGLDAGLPDAGELDAGVHDAGMMATDGGVDDGGTFDGGVVDAGVPDAGVPDAGVPDAGAGVPSQLACAPAVYMTSGQTLENDKVYRHRPNGAVDAEFDVPYTVKVVPLKRTSGAALAVLSLLTGVVQIFDGTGALTTSFSPLMGNAGAITACDFDLDGDDDVLVGTKAGVSAQYAVTLADGTALQPVTAIANHTGALSVACGDVDGVGGSPLVIVGPGYSANNSVRVFTFQGALLNTFQPYGSSHWDGVEVAVAKLSHTGPERIVTAHRAFLPTQVRVFSSGGALLASQDVFASNYTSGSTVSAADLDADGLDELVVSQRTQPGAVTVLSSMQLLPFGGWNNAWFQFSGANVSATPRAAWSCPTTPPDAGVDAGVDAGTPQRDAGAGCTADEGQLLYATPSTAVVYTRVRQRHGSAWFTIAGANGVASVWQVPLDGGLETLVANAVREPTGLMVTDEDLYFSDKGVNGQLNGTIVHVPLDGGASVTVGSMQDFPIDVARVTIDAGTGASDALVWLNAGNRRLLRTDLTGGNAVISPQTLINPEVFTTDTTHAYYSTSTRAVVRLPLDFTGNTQASIVVSSQSFPIDPIYAMQVVGDDLFILHSAGLPNARTGVLRVSKDGTGAPTPVVTVNGVQSRAMHIVNGWIYVAEGGYAPGCSTYRIWRVPVTAAQTSSVEPVANSEAPFSDFAIGPDWLVMLRNGVWVAPSP